MSITNNKQTMLIVDDEPTNIILLQTIFKAEYRITAATNGERALAIAAQQPQPDLILLDVMMPAMDGFSVLQQLKSDTETQDISVIFVTAKLGDEDEKKGLELGALDYVSKPINANSVKAKVKNHMVSIRQRNFIQSLVKEQSESLMKKDNDSQKQQVENEAIIKGYLETIKADSERLSLALWASGNELWDVDVTNGKIERSDGLDEFRLPTKFDSNGDLCETFAQVFKEYIHPLDLEVYIHSLRQLADAVSDTFSIEYRIKSTQNKWIWLHDKGRVIKRGDNGEIKRMAGTIQNVHARKEDEKASRTIAHAFKSTSDGVWVTNEELNIQLVNDAFVEITELKPEDMIGKRLYYPDVKGQGDDFVERIMKELHRSSSWTGEVWSKRGNELYPVDLRISKVENAEDCSIQYVGIFTDITYRKRAEEELIKLANYDQLTKLPNRTLLHERLQKIITGVRGEDLHFAIIFIDLDGFKLVNDTLGHNVGDQLLIQVAERLIRISREQDTVSRLGGDEFVILIEPQLSNHIIAKIAQRVLDAIAIPFELEGRDITITASLGVALCPEDGQDMDSLMKNADVAMFEAKADGKAGFKFYTDAMTKDALERLDLESDLRKAVSDDQIFLHYQPKVQVESGEIDGLEALARWELRGEMIRPDVFIKVAEEMGLIVELGKNILRRACFQYQEWVKQDLVTGRIAVNLSAPQLMADDLLDLLKSILEETELPPHFLELEITETAVIANVEKATRQMRGIRDLGVHLAMDDFGTGYSSLSYLTHFPLNTLKVDQCFIRDMLSDPRSKSIVETIINMAHTLDLNVVAEGVEVIEQADMLRELNGEIIQGYLFSKPVSPSEFEQLLKDRKNLYGDESNLFR